MVMMKKHLTMQLILTALGLSTFQQKLKKSQETKISSQIFMEYKYTIQQCLGNLVLNLLILC